MRVVLLAISTSLATALIGCSTAAPVHSEQGLAKRIGKTSVVEGVFESDSKGEWVHTAWGRVPIQRADRGSPPLDQGVYVWATGNVSRGQLVNGSFVPTPADFRGLRMSHDLILLKAKLQRPAPPATQPTTMPFMEAK